MLKFYNSFNKICTIINSIPDIMSKIGLSSFKTGSIPPKIASIASKTSPKPYEMVLILLRNALNLLRYILTIVRWKLNNQ